MFAWNLLLALAWCAMAGELTAVQFGAGFGIAYLMLGWLAPIPEARDYLHRVPRFIGYAVAYGLEVIGSAARVAVDVVTLRPRRRPAVFAVPLEARTDAEIALLANLISFTPGSLTLDVSGDRRTMLVHAMFAPDIVAAREQVKRLEKRVLRILR